LGYDNNNASGQEIVGANSILRLDDQNTGPILTNI
jgi:hypothetical protein